MNYFDYNVLFDQLISESVDPETGEIINPDFEAQLTALQMDKEEKIEQVALAFKEAKADVETLQKIIDGLERKKEAKESFMEFCKGWIDSQLTGKFKTLLVSIYRSPTKKTEITDENAIPAEFIKTTTSIQKGAIKKAIQAGVDVPGAKLVDSEHIVIR